ncbi:MAG: tyrosine-type recombinase/integrase [Oligoflexia bacterium]|nr:tyrosine-type recombinase/integrase [Oligoflexia bacterium]
MIKCALNIKYRSKRESFKPYTYSTLISLLWVSGLRIGEALRLNIEDIDFERLVLNIRLTKFFKSRLVPISKSTGYALKKYLQLRKSYGYKSKLKDPVFINSDGVRCKITNVDVTFPCCIFLVKHFINCLFQH